MDNTTREHTETANKNPATEKIVQAPWSEECDALVNTLDTDPEKGLTSREARKRLKQYGPNRIVQKKSKSAWTIFLYQVKNFIVLLLFVAALASFAFTQWLEGISILIALAINVLIGFFTELKATRSMEAITRLSKVKAKVLREGSLSEIPSEQIVPGDIIHFESGDVIFADIRILEGSRIQANESTLTGESVPVKKTTEPVDKTAPLPERSSMMFKGTSLTLGSGKGLVVGTGENTELGNIATMTEEAESDLTPLEKRLVRLGQHLIWVTLMVASLIAIVGFVKGMDLFLLIETSIALAVAAIPEGLPIVATLALAKGMWRMAARNALVNRLSSVETLGTTSVICTDKTGTLTENRLSVAALASCDKDRDQISRLSLGKSEEPDVAGDEKKQNADNPVLSAALRVGVLCSNAKLENTDGSTEGIGDPLEVALLRKGDEYGFQRRELLDSLPEEREEAFDPDTQMMATVHQAESGYYFAVKGAPEAVLDASTHVLTPDGPVEMGEDLRKRFREQNTELGKDGLRILGLAQKNVSQASDSAYRDLVFIGLVGLLDPPRQDIKHVIEDLKQAGIRVVMVTGDMASTALSIGTSLNLASKDQTVVTGDHLEDVENKSKEEQASLYKNSIFARITPKQKLNIISIFQSQNAVVAMTGDGVNDAPALKKADIGIAMGQRGTQVAKEASDIILKDDSFATIAAAVEQGRNIFNNIRKFILFLLSGNVGEILIVGLAILAGAPLPILPLQILYLNMISDVFPALALGLGPGEHDVMYQPPRKSGESIVTLSHWMAIIFYGGIICAAVLGGFYLALEKFQMAQKEAVSVAFLTLAFARTWHVFNMRDKDSNLLINGITRNPFVWGAIGISITLLLIAIFLSPLAYVLSLTPPTLTGWTIILGMSLVPLIIGQIMKFSFIPTPWRIGQ